MPVLLALLVLLPEASACESDADALTVLHPQWQPLHPDDGVWLELRAPGLDLQVLEDGVGVAVERHTLGPYDVIFLEGGWDPASTYEVVYGIDSKVLDAATEGETPAASAPSASRRFVWAESYYEVYEGDGGCLWDPTGEWASNAGAALTACSRDLRLVSALGDQEPPAPALDDGVDWWLTEREARFDSDGDWPDAGPGASATVWLGTLDARGGFSGWVAEPVTLPDARTQRRDVREGVATDATPTSWGDSCPRGDWVLGDVEPAPGPPEADAVEAEGCGCTTSPSGGLAWLLGLAAFARRRRHA